jgi:AcrR family transcriptional regulator
MSGQDKRPQPGWARRSEHRPAEIAAAALRLFAEQGFAATKLEDVAREAGISKGTLYLYFTTKEELFRAVVRKELLPNLEKLEAAAGAYTGSIATLLRQLVDPVADLIASEVAVIPKLILSEAGNFPEIAAFYAEEVVGRGMRLFDHILQRGIESGEFKPAKAADLLPIFAGPVLLLLLWRHSIGPHSPAEFDTQAVLRTHIEMFLRGLSADQAA